jgi:uncharacterized membrane protein
MCGQGDDRVREHRHRNFILSAILALVSGAVIRATGGVTLALPLVLIVADMFSALYLVLLLSQAAGLTPDVLRRHATDADEGLPLILLVAVGIVATSMTAIFLVLAAPGGVSVAGGGLALCSVPLGWAMLHSVFAFHYAREFYTPQEGEGDGARDTGGLEFPGTPEPGIWEFLYFSFVIGMTAQVSDVVVKRTPMRRLALSHSVLAFFFNTVILALAVNAAVNLGR